MIIITMCLNIIYYVCMTYVGSIYYVCMYAHIMYMCMETDPFNVTKF